jgi:hypothetical protein
LRILREGKVYIEANMKKLFSINTLFWIIYVALLAVLFPHTAWAFGQFEQSGGDQWVPWAAALAFEAAIAAITSKLSNRIENTPKRLSAWRKFSYRYLNSYSLGLIGALGISTLANLAHAVEFGRDMTIFSTWRIPASVYAVAFGAVLPFISLIFASVLSNVVESEAEEDPELAQAKDQLVDLRKQLRDVTREKDTYLQRATVAEARFTEAGDLMRMMFAEDKRVRILAVHEQWPTLPGAAVATITESSPAYVSEVIKSAEVQE